MSIIEFFLYPFKKVYWHLQYRACSRFDREFGVETCAPVELSELNIEAENSEHGVDYNATPVKRFHSIMATLPQDLSEYVFVDFGSGKGRVIMMASEYNFTQIIGLEFSNELFAIAQANIAKYRNERQKCFDIRPVCTDVVDFRIPDKKCIFFFYNPFREPVMSQVLENIGGSFHRMPRKMHFILYNPRLISLFENQDFLRQVERRKFFLNNWIHSPNNRVLFFETR